MIKNIFILSLLFCTVLIYSQKTKKKFKVEYLNMSSFSVAKNTESKFSTFSKDSITTYDGIGFDVNTIHGAKFFGYFAISAGMSIDWNINKTFLTTPFIVDARLFLNKESENSTFVYLQTGQNIKWSEKFEGKGTTSKIGVGFIFEYNESISYYLDLFKKSKVIELNKFKDKGNYSIISYGLSLGIIF